MPGGGGSTLPHWSGVTLAVNLATGGTPPLAAAAAAAVANLVQVTVFLALLGRWCPHLWGAGGSAPVSRLAELWRLLLATAACCACGALISRLAAWLFSGDGSWLSDAVWLTRNAVSLLLIGIVGLRLGQLLSVQAGGPGDWLMAVRDSVRRMTAHRTAELFALVTCSAGVSLRSTSP